MGVETWDERYSRGENAFLEPVPLLLEAAAMIPPGHALDLACGLGRHALELARLGWRVTAADSSGVAIDRLRGTAAAESLPVDARLVDLEAGEFPIEEGAYDLIADFFYLQRDLFPRIAAGLRPGGLFVAVIHLAEPPGAPPARNPAFRLQPGELRSCFPDWELLVYTETASNPSHRRPAVAMIARKPVAGHLQ